MNTCIRMLNAVVALVLCASLARAGDPLKVVATIPDLADVVREIGGDRVDVTTITRGKENLHAVKARPSHMIALSRADLFVEVGLSLEVSFVPALLENARNDRIRAGAPGFVNVSVGWEALNVPQEVSRKAGDIHPQGNPHLNLDPRAGAHVAKHVLDALVRVDAGSKTEYERRHAAYAERLAAAEARWRAAGEAWKGARVVMFHQEFDYLAAYHALEIAGKVESKPGIPPTPTHVAELIRTMKERQCRVILTAPWSNGNDVTRIAEATGARVVELPNQCGAVAGSETWIGMMDEIHRRLGAAFAAAGTGGK
jgi:zinc/manganese transport system substrate-binding protein